MKKELTAVLEAAFAASPDQIGLFLALSDSNGSRYASECTTTRKPTKHPGRVAAGGARKEAGRKKTYPIRIRMELHSQYQNMCNEETNKNIISVLHQRFNSKYQSKYGAVSESTIRTYISEFSSDS